MVDFRCKASENIGFCVFFCIFLRQIHICYIIQFRENRYKVQIILISIINYKGVFGIKIKMEITSITLVTCLVYCKVRETNLPQHQRLIAQELFQVLHPIFFSLSLSFHHSLSRLSLQFLSHKIITSKNIKYMLSSFTSAKRFMLYFIFQFFFNQEIQLELNFLSLQCSMSIKSFNL